MKRLFRLVAIMAMVWMSAATEAASVSMERARNVADMFLAGNRAEVGARKAPRRVRRAMPAMSEQQQFYMFETEGGGFVLIAADDCAHPVLGYGKKAPWNGEQWRQPMPANVRAWLEGYNSSICAAVADGYVAPESVRAEWQALEGGGEIEADPVVAPLIKTEWNQQQEYINVPNTYNYYTPAGSVTYEGEVYYLNTPTGCMATAMAQVMKYWEWPVKGTGSHSYIPETHPEYGVLSANFGKTTYDWAHMPEKLTYDGSTETEIKAVAQLMYHCGVALEMDYDDLGSSAYSVTGGKYEGYYPAEYALTTWFGYSNTEESYMRDEFASKDDWVWLLKQEMNAARPVLYSGGSHSFICCGYDTKDRFYFNFGWGGYSDGYYEVDAIQPEDSGVGGNASHNYSTKANIIVGIRPATTAGEKAYDYALRLHYDSNYPTYYAPSLGKDSLWYLGEKLNVTISIANYDTIAYNGKVALQVVDSTGKVICMSEANTLSMEDFTLSDEEFTIEPSIALCPGHYHVQPVYSNPDGSWTPIDARHYWSNLAFTVYYWSNIFAYSEMTVSPDPLVQNKRAKISINVANLTGAPISGTFLAELYDLDGNYMQTLGELDLSASPLNDRTYTPCTFKDSTVRVDPGEYLLLVVYQDEDGLFVVGCDWYNTVRRVTVVSEAEAPVPDEYLLTMQELVPFGYNGEDVQLTIYEGDTICAYVGIANEGKQEYSGYLLLELYDADYKEVGYVIYSCTIAGESQVSSSMQVDTTLEAGSYMMAVFYYDPVTEKFFTPEEDKVSYWCEFSVLKKEPTALDEAVAEVRVYPNPVTDRLTVEGAAVRQWSLYSLSGQQVVNGTEANRTVPMGGMPAGQYILRIKDAEGRTSSHRIIKR